MIGLVVVGHDPLPSALLNCARHVFGGELVQCVALDVPATSDVAGYVETLRARIREVDDGQGVLVLCDLFGATPANIASQLVRAGAVEVLTGVNLPMLLRALSYRANASLEVVIEKASAGANAGVMKIASTAPQNQRLPAAAGQPDTSLEPESGTDNALARMHDQQ